MRFDYGAILSVVNDLLPQFGTDCTAVTTTNDYSPSNPTGETVEVVTHGKGVMDDIKAPFGEYTNPVESGDMLLICTPSLKLKTGSVATIDEQDWVVVDPRPIKPANLILAYQAHVRRA